MLNDENKSVIMTMLKKLREVGKNETEIKHILIQAGFVATEIDSIIELSLNPSPEQKIDNLKRELHPNLEPEDNFQKSFFEKTSKTPLEENKNNSLPSFEQLLSKQKDLEFSPPPLDKTLFGNEAEKEIPKDDFLKPLQQKQTKQNPEVILNSSSTNVNSKTTPIQEKILSNPTPPSNSNSLLNFNQKNFKDPLDSYRKKNIAQNELNSKIIKMILIAIIAVILISIIGYFGMKGLGNTPTPLNNNNTNSSLNIVSTISLDDFSSGYQPKILLENTGTNTIKSDIYTLYVDEIKCAQTLSTIKEIQTNEKITFFFNEISKPCQFADNLSIDVNSTHKIKITSPNGTNVIQII